jgi:hypothetical protein
VVNRAFVENLHWQWGQKNRFLGLRSVLNALESIRQKALKDGRPLSVLQSDNGKEFQNHAIRTWMVQHDITPQQASLPL